MNKKINMTLRVDPDIKAQASALFSDLGCDLGTAMNMFMVQAIKQNGFPFEIKEEPNALTMAAIREALHMDQDSDVKKFDNVDDLFDELES
ncbi:type II toxin-antitoxin system RelB/DinJ family antitoxin [Aminicella lysinilytica]|uniref:DNA-damage-inducible protein J n=1 Tax=Aminicella lysinilytica TaxID=433323 RepID=A0A4R6Q2L5_9FIRM|nr:type II toxin-antitoxin system RelB/DinJ family antitoxin [Aminicella lysinilytica]NLD11527.1 type II toxin-antitoxin system RelB/DinJ family antitoxin [Clostridiales bacterium]TDP56431.1 DNA-damage-inducible protein J [Aminicella lysinilytica]